MRAQVVPTQGFPMQPRLIAFGNPRRTSIAAKAASASKMKATQIMIIELRRLLDREKNGAGVVRVADHVIGHACVSSRVRWIVTSDSAPPRSTRFNNHQHEHGKRRTCRRSAEGRSG
jgi:hypothetical protein